MPDRPLSVWKDMPLEKRVRAAEAFWRDTESPDIEVQQMEATLSLARRLNFRAKSIQSLPVARKARHLAQSPDVSDAIATRALVAYHFTDQRPLMSAFLDGLGVSHDNGLITAEEVPPPDRARLAAAVSQVQETFDREDVRLYLRTLGALDSATWAHVDEVLQD
jgi:hypothetical protein